VTLEEAVRESLAELRGSGAPSLVVQLQASKQLAQQQCQLITQAQAASEVRGQPSDSQD
jgi:hypothetical protein